MKNKTIGLFALSNCPDPELLASGIAKMEAEGRTVVLPPDGLQTKFRRMAGDDKWRALNFNMVLRQPKIDMMMAVRGGYGVTRCLDYIDWDYLLEHNILVVGYSDVTALLLAAYSKGFRSGICGPMVCNQWNEPDEKIRRQIFASFERAMQNEDLVLKGYKVLKSGRSSGPGIPVNLSLLESMIGTKYMPDLAGAILILEDVAEPSHSIDRRLNHLKMSGILSAIGGLAFGQFTQGEDSEYIPEILADYAAVVNGPVIGDLPFGHINPSMSIRMGQNVIIEADDNL